MSMARGAAYRLRVMRELLAGKTLTVTMEGTGAATAKMYPDKIVVEAAAAQVSKYINIETPFDFEVIGVKTIHRDANDCSVTVSNGANAISDAIAIAASDKDTDRDGEIDDAYEAFAAGDNDLRITPGTDALVGKVIIWIQLT